MLGPLARGYAERSVPLSALALRILRAAVAEKPMACAWRLGVATIASVRQAPCMALTRPHARTSKMRKVKYGKRIATARSAAGASGVPCMSFDGRYFFRVYRSRHRFTDYYLRHSDLAVTISPDDEASFYRIGDDYVLDHSPETLGLEVVSHSSPRTKRGGAKGNVSRT
jgi:hypothetical protein